MQSQGIVQSGCEVAGCAAVFGEIGNIDITFDITAEVCTAGIFQRKNRTLVDILTFLELNFRAIIDTGDATECEHKREVLGPCILRSAEAVVAVGSIVMRIDIHHIISSIVI